MKANCACLNRRRSNVSKRHAIVSGYLSALQLTMNGCQVDRQSQIGSKRTCALSLFRQQVRRKYNQPSSAKNLHSFRTKSISGFAAPSGIGLNVELVLALLSAIAIFVFAAIVRIFGTDYGYKILFAIIAFAIVMKTYLG